ncbi:hypothetical protein, partial [Burkholderia sp. D-99]|uniref:hypothetical protein n=1 Tax=Burkholderia sp. D-99 TaxID=2717316 RepID=UPI001AA106A9
ISAAEKRDYEPCFAARQQLFYTIVATAGFNFQASCALQTSTAPLPFFLPRRVSVSAKEA